MVVDLSRIPRLEHYDGGGGKKKEHCEKKFRSNHFSSETRNEKFWFVGRYVRN